MTAGHIATPLRQIRTSLLVAAVIVTFGIGLLAGLNVSRIADQGTTAVPVAAAPFSSKALNGPAFQDDRPAERADLAAAAPAAGVHTDQLDQSRITADGQDIRLGTPFDSVTLPVAAPEAKPVAVRSRITADGQDIQLGSRMVEP
ncbi:MAG: hypothetical protein ACLQHS_15540 [Candidatus Limnocylindrales bacterium]